MTDRLQLGSIDLIATRFRTGTGEYDWVEHDDQPSYAFTFDSSAGCTDGCGAGGGVLTADTLTYIVRPIEFTCYSANGKTAAVNRDNLLAVLNAATAYSLKATCSPAYTGAPVILIRQAGDQATPDVWTVKRYQRKAVRLDLNKTRIMLDVDLYCVEGGPVIDTVTGHTVIGSTGNPVQGGPLNGSILQVQLGAWTRTGADPPRDLGMWGNERIVVAAGSWDRTGGA